MKELSSPFTFLYKFVFLFLWIAGFGLGTHEVLLAGPAEPRWLQYMASWIAIAVCIFFATGSIKKVSMAQNKLHVSNFFRTEVIDTSEIIVVDGATFLSPRLVWFILRSPSGFGTKITFMPAHRHGKGIGKHPLVQELAEELQL